MKKDMKRTLLRVVFETDEVVTVLIPTWDKSVTFQIEKHQLPFKVKVNDRMTANVNFAARSKIEMVIKDFEKVPEPTENFLT